MTNTKEAMIAELVADIKESYLGEDSTVISPEEILEASSVDTTDFCHLMNSLNSCDGYRVHLTIQSQDESYEQMSSRFVVFVSGEATPVYGIFFDDVMMVHDDEYKGLNLDGVTKVLEAIESHAKQKSA